MSDIQEELQRLRIDKEHFQKRVFCPDCKTAFVPYKSKRTKKLSKNYFVSDCKCYGKKIMIYVG
jgi:RNase P subunit RPR2